MAIHAVIFDRDHTLLRFDREAVQAIEQQISRIVPGIPAGAAATHWLSWAGPWPTTPADEGQFWERFWQSLGRRYQVSKLQLAQLEQLGGFYHTCFTAYPDARPCVEALYNQGIRLAVLTNFELPSVDRTLEHAGLNPAWFEVLLSSAAIGVYKPAPEAYQIVLNALELRPEECGFVDDLQENVVAAQNMGMHAIRIDRSSVAEPAPDCISSLEELPQILPLTTQMKARSVSFSAPGAMHV